jgi:hypothetical protein
VRRFMQVSFEHQQLSTSRLAQVYFEQQRLHMPLFML